MANTLKSLYKPDRTKRGLKSIYFDKRTYKIDKASSFNSYPAYYPTRFLFIGQFFKVPNLNNKKVKQVLSENNFHLHSIKMILAKRKKKMDLPF